ncbi:MAG: hypothetical protein IKX14_00850 [Neisseriaceae bacterium]|nr:hypothetical protein [Neisseriaceae bacterium]
MKTKEVAEHSFSLEEILGKEGVLALLNIIDTKVEDTMMTAKGDIITAINALQSSTQSEIKATQSEIKATKVYNIIAVITLILTVVGFVSYFAALALGLIGK